MDYAAELKEVEPRNWLPRMEARKQALELLAPIVEHALRPHLPSSPPRAIGRVVRKHLRVRIAEVSTPAANKEERHTNALQAILLESANCTVSAELTSKYPTHQLTAYMKLAGSLSFVVDDVLREVGAQGAARNTRATVAENILSALLREEDVLYYISNPIRAAETAMNRVVDFLSPQIMSRH